MVTFYNIVGLLLYFDLLFHFTAAGSYYITVERPVVQYVKADYVTYLNISSRRFGRRNPKYYVDIHVAFNLVMDNSIVFDMYFYELILNHYRPSFLEFHFKWCNLLTMDSFMGAALRANVPDKCPHPPGSYHLYNMTFNEEAIPPNFPFTKGRLIVNATKNHQRLASCYADIELKENRQRAKSKGNK